ncbi:hypothetical protein QFZ24_009982 [Streptomyces phaeochromogenes]|jgi:hypothetical protein|nr:hypothetical protein [Streptomyces phaeochromogenes]
MPLLCNPLEWVAQQRHPYGSDAFADPSPAAPTTSTADPQEGHRPVRQAAGGPSAGRPSAAAVARIEGGRRDSFSCLCPSPKRDLGCPYGLQHTVKTPLVDTLWLLTVVPVRRAAARIGELFPTRRHATARSSSARRATGFHWGATVPGADSTRATGRSAASWLWRRGCSGRGWMRRRFGDATVPPASSSPRDCSAGLRAALVRGHRTTSRHCQGAGSGRCQPLMSAPPGGAAWWSAMAITNPGRSPPLLAWSR